MPLPAEFLPLLEEASNTDDPTLSSMFARLLASQLDATENKGHPSFNKIMGQLSPLDAKVLHIVDDSERRGWERHREQNKQADEIIKKAGAEEFDPRGRDYNKPDRFEQALIKQVMKRFPGTTEGEIEISILNLIRLGLCDGESFGVEEKFFFTCVNMTKFGVCFLKAVFRQPDYWRVKFPPKRTNYRLENAIRAKASERPSK